MSSPHPSLDAPATPGSAATADGQAATPEAVAPRATLDPTRPISSGSGQRRNTQFYWLIILRVVVVSTLLLSALLIPSITGIDFSALNPIYYLVGSTYVLTLVYLAIFILVGRTFILAQLAGDLVIITALIYYSGGLESAFPFLYIPIIITASMALRRRSGLWMALFACVLYGALIALIYNRVVSLPVGFLAVPAAKLTMSQVYYNLFVRWIGFLASAFLSSYIADKLREAGQTLEERSADLEKLQVFYEDVINSVNSGLLSTDMAGRVGSLNHAGERILEVRLAQVSGRRIEDVLGLPAEVRDRLPEMGPEGIRFEQVYRTGAGAAKYLEASVSGLFDRSNLQRGYALVLQDVTLLKELEKEVRLNERMAAVGEMGAGIAHEIRNPLASVSGSIQMLRGDLDLTGDQRALMDIVVRESDRLNRIIEEFLFYAKPSPPIPKAVSLTRLVEETVAIFRNSSELLPSHRVEVEALTREDTVVADPDQLRQVFWNLLRNAVQAMPSGGRLWVRIDADPGGATVTVEDEGRGFNDVTDMELAWEPFKSSSGAGTGLGLAIVYRIVREHGGRVSISNREPCGARIRLWLPGPPVNAVAPSEECPLEPERAVTDVG